MQRKRTDRKEISKTLPKTPYSTLGYHVPDEYKANCCHNIRKPMNSKIINNSRLNIDFVVFKTEILFQVSVAHVKDYR
jgi:hypothetical protein